MKHKGFNCVVLEEKDNKVHICRDNGADFEYGWVDKSELEGGDIYPVSCDGMLLAVEAFNKQEAEEKAKKYTENKGLKIGYMHVYNPNTNYDEWIRYCGINIVC